MDPANTDGTPQTPDPLGNDPASLQASAQDAGQSQGEDAVEDEVSDIVSTKGGEPRSFAPADDVDPGENPADAKQADKLPMEADKHVDKQLDHGLKETFPASDPVSINPGAD